MVGARSAVFAPVPRLGLVIVDEEHETSYKQDESPRYNGRDVAVERARRAGALCILGSATPSMESYVRARRGEYRLARLTKRVDDRPLPPIEIVDMRREMLAGNRTIFSRRLQEELARCLAQRRQALLFLNRRGFAQFLLCRECGLVVRCDECAVAYTFHAEPAPHLRCHYCNELRAVPERCPQCSGPYLRPFGAGTQRVETLVKSMFPEARVQRVDLDTTARKDAHVRFYEAVRRGEVDVIVGTQMVAKGLDFPNVTLVGVVAADSTLHLPDFRAAERTFQLLTQVAGRAGRGLHPGRVDRADVRTGALQRHGREGLRRGRFLPTRDGVSPRRRLSALRRAGAHIDLHGRQQPGSAASSRRGCAALCGPDGGRLRERSGAGARASAQGPLAVARSHTGSRRRAGGKWPRRLGTCGPRR